MIDKNPISLLNFPKNYFKSLAESDIYVGSLLANIYASKSSAT